MKKDEFITLLINKSKENNIYINNKQAEKMYEYKNILLEWNEKINLTAITDDEDIIVKHFVDSLLSVEHIVENTKIIDVGTGAGFPGIIIAIYFDGKVNITLLDSLQKRINFLNEVIEKLKLKNIKAIHGRAEEFAHKEEFRECYDIAIARAVAPLNVLLEYLMPFAKVNGKCLCMKGSSSEEEIENSKNAIKVLGGELIKTEDFCIPNTDIVRRIVQVNKIKETNNKYPRKAGTPSKEPL